MAETKRADQIGTGEEFEPYEFRVTPEFNQQYLDALDDHHPRYTQETVLGPPIVHPSLLLHQSNIPKSPSFYLPPGVSTIHSKEEVEHINPGRVGKTFTVHWKVVDMYEKRSRPYQVKEVLIVDEDGVEILRRMVTDTFFTGRDDRE